MLPLPKSMVVLSLAVPEKHVRQNFFLYKLSVSQMPRAAAFQARHYPAAGILPPHRGAELDGMGRDGSTHAVPPAPAGSPAAAFPGHCPSTTPVLLLASSLRVFLYMEKFAEEALRLRIVVEFGYTTENSAAQFPS